MKVKLVVAHPRQNSLTFAVMNRFIDGMKENHHEIDILDLYHDGFDPLYSLEDERDWQNPNKQHAPVIRKELDRVLAADAIVLGGTICLPCSKPIWIKYGTWVC